MAVDPRRLVLVSYRPDVSRIRDMYITEDWMRSLMAQFGTISCIHIIKTNTKVPHGYVTFTTRKAAQEALSARSIRTQTDQVLEVSAPPRPMMVKYKALIKAKAPNANCMHTLDGITGRDNLWARLIVLDSRPDEIFILGLTRLQIETAMSKFGTVLDVQDWVSRSSQTPHVFVRFNSAAHSRCAIEEESIYIGGQLLNIKKPVESALSKYQLDGAKSDLEDYTSDRLQNSEDNNTRIPNVRPNDSGEVSSDQESRVVRYETCSSTCNDRKALLVNLREDINNRLDDAIRALHDLETTINECDRSVGGNTLHSFNTQWEEVSSKCQSLRDNIFASQAVLLQQNAGTDGDLEPGLEPGKLSWEHSASMLSAALSRIQLKMDNSGQTAKDSQEYLAWSAKEIEKLKSTLEQVTQRVVQAESMALQERISNVSQLAKQTRRIRELEESLAARDSKIQELESEIQVHRNRELLAPELYQAMASLERLWEEAPTKKQRIV